MNLQVKTVQDALQEYQNVTENEKSEMHKEIEELKGELRKRLIISDNIENQSI